MGKIECKTCGVHEHHEHHHHEHDTKEQLRLIIITAVLLVGAVVVEHWLQLETWQLLLVYLIPSLSDECGHHRRTVYRFSAWR